MYFYITHTYEMDLISYKPSSLYYMLFGGMPTKKTACSIQMQFFPQYFPFVVGGNSECGATVWRYGELTVNFRLFV